VLNNGACASLCRSNFYDLLKIIHDFGYLLKLLKIISFPAAFRALRLGRAGTIFTARRERTGYLK
jgi:hypothetical protein